MILNDDNIFDILSCILNKTIKTEYDLTPYVKSNYSELNPRRATECIKEKYLTITGSEKVIILNKSGLKFIKKYIRHKRFSINRLILVGTIILIILTLILIYLEIV